MRLVIISPAFEAPAVVAGFDPEIAEGSNGLSGACTGALDWAS
jgi:hypothetical protein